MGYKEWSTDVYEELAHQRAATGQPVFAYDDQLSRLNPSQRKIHPTLDPLGVRVRESRDSDEHPTSKGVAVFLDVSGTMDTVVRALHASLPQLNGVVRRNNYLDHPQFLFGAVGDAYCDAAPLQVGQFESDNRMDENIANLWLEGGGGGQKRESYDLALYEMARHSDLDCYNKRGERGYLFIVGDEMYYPVVRAHQVREFIGDVLQADIPTAEIVAEVLRKFETYFILPEGAYYGGDREVKGEWRRLLGERVLDLEDPDGLAGLIAWQIGLNEGRTDLDAGVTQLAAQGVNQSTIKSIRKALATQKVVPVKSTISLPGLIDPRLGDSKLKRL